MRYVALLRAVNVGGRRVPMAELRALAADLGFEGVTSYIQSGNLIVSSELDAEGVRRALESGVRERFGIEVPVIVRTAEGWAAYLSDNPFPDASRTRPNLVMLALAASAPDPGAAQALEARGTAGERVRRVRDALWIDFPDGSARSKLTPSVIDRLVGAPTTTRNWRTVQKLAELVAGGEDTS